MNYLGIDPSQRHTGLCSLKMGAEPEFFEIKTGDADLLTSIRQIRKQFREFVGVDMGACVIALEKQVLSGQSSQLLFYVQMAIFEEIDSIWEGSPRVVAPLPVQLKAYMRGVHSVDIKSKTTIVEGYRRARGIQERKRISSHCVEAYFLARLAKDVVEGRWKYKLPSREEPLVPWPILNGGMNGRSE